MSVGFDDLMGGERAFVEWLAQGLDSSPSEVLARLEAAPQTSEGVRTRVTAGRFVSLSLAGVGAALRWAVGERALRLDLSALSALEAVDCSGMELDGLELTGLERLVRLVCSENRLRELDLSGLPSLDVLDSSGNDLMVLDLRACPRLRVLDCSGNEISALVVPTDSRLESLRCGRNQLMVLELGDQPHLRELNCYRNALAHLDIGAAPELRDVDCARNQLASLPVQNCARLERLDCGRNRLGALTLPRTETLRSLRVGHNYIASLDLEGLVGLTEVLCPNNQLASLRLGTLPQLAVLDCHRNRLRSLELDGCPGLEVLECASNELTALNLPGSALCALDCSENALTQLDVSHCAGLARLYCGGNPFETLDIRANPELHVLHSVAGTAPEVLATDAQRHRILELRRRHGLGTGTEDVAEMDSWELHDFAASYQGSEAEAKLLEVVRHPACDRGTALMIYWTNAPHYYLRYASRQEVQPYEQAGWDLLEAIEERIRSDRFEHREIWFDPHHDKQTRSVRGHDWTVDDTLTDRPTKREIPSDLLAPAGRER